MGGGKPGKFKDSIQPSEEFEVLDITGTANNTMTWFQQYLKDISKAPVAKQAAVGGISGWVVGFISMKVGKAAATVVGGSLIIIQLAAHQGYIKQIDWNRVNNDLETHAKKLTKEVESRMRPGMADEASLSRRFDKVLNKATRRMESLENEADSWFTKRLKNGQKMYRKYILGKSSEITIEDFSLQRPPPACGATAMDGGCKSSPIHAKEDILSLPSKKGAATKLCLGLSTGVHCFPGGCRVRM